MSCAVDVGFEVDQRLLISSFSLRVASMADSTSVALNLFLGIGPWDSK